MNAQPHQLSKIGEFGIWELVPQVATITVGVLDMWTNFFQREAEDLVLLFQYTDGDSRGCVYQLFQASRIIPVITHILAGLK